MTPSNRPLPFGLSAGLVIGGALLAGAANAASQSSRGYQGCVDAADVQAQMIAVDADYYLYEQTESRRFYLNGYAFVNGNSEPVKISCETTLSGARVLDVAVGPGRYAGRMAAPVNVARN